MTINEQLGVQLIKQQDITPESIEGLQKAYWYLWFVVSDEEITEINVRLLGNFCKPDLNPQACWRRTPVVFADGSSAVSPDVVPRAMERNIAWANLLRRGKYPVVEDGPGGEKVVSFTAEEWYQDFQQIHPFRDGNGRVGFLLYNWIHGTLDDPMQPPEFQQP